MVPPVVPPTFAAAAPALAAALVPPLASLPPLFAPGAETEDGCFEQATSRNTRAARLIMAAVLCLR